MGWRDVLHNMGPGPLGLPSSGGPGSPGTSGGQNSGQLEPNTRAGNMAAGVPYRLVPVYPPFVRIADDPNIVYFPRFRTLIFGGGAVVAATTTQSFQFSVPTIIIARTAAAFLPVGTAFDVGRNPLDGFLAQFSRGGSQSDLIDAGGGGAANPSVQTAGSALFGDGKLPGFVPGNGLFIDVGGILNVTVQTLINNITAHVCIWCVEEYGPARG